MKALELLDRQEKGKTSKSVSRLFGITFIILFITGLMFRFYGANFSKDLYFYEVYSTIGHTLFWGSFIFLFFCIVHYLAPKLTNDKTGLRFGKLHFWGTLICELIIAYDSPPRRLYNYDDSGPFVFNNYVDTLVSIAVIGFVLFQFIFLLNAILCIFRKSPNH